MPHTSPTDTPSAASRWFMPAVGLLIAIVGLVVMWVNREPAPVGEKPGDGSLVEQKSSPADYLAELLRSPPIVPPREPQGKLAGSAACAECHAEICQSFAASPMGRAIALASAGDGPERYDDNARFQTIGRREYRVERRADGVWHHEIQRDKQGELLYDQAAPIQYAIGSGAHGRSYAIERGGLLFQSPISWMTGDGGHWDLSPGYSPLENLRFDRRIGTACLLCHAGEVQTDPAGEDRFQTPAVLEHSISCERCHGPGQAHIERQRTAATKGGDNTIVHPARLDTAQRESLCNQCHLIGEQRVPRYGRKFEDYRPGDDQEELWVVLTKGGKLNEASAFESVGHVEQLRLSRCFQAGDGQLGCTSCHDPHRHIDVASAAEHFRQRCLTCHADRGCSLPLAQRDRAPFHNSCYECHMPRVGTSDAAHTAQTDHRIPRSPGLDRQQAGSAAESGLQFFNQADRRLPAWEADRALGIALVYEADEMPSAADGLLDQAEALLAPLAAALPDDLRLWESLARGASLRRRDSATEHWERVLRLQPRHEAALDALGHLAEDRGDAKSMLAHSTALLQTNPWLGRYHYLHARALSLAGEPQAAAESAEKALEIDPTSVDCRTWLIAVYRTAGDLSAAGRHADFLRRLQGE